MFSVDDEVDAALAWFDPANGANNQYSEDEKQGKIIRREVLRLRAKLAAQDEAMGRIQAVVDDMPDNECTCGADDGDNLGSGGQETGCYMHELLAALSPAAKQKEDAI